MQPRIGASHCPIIECTADGVSVGRCWHYLADGKTCPRHGDVGVTLLYYLQTGKLTRERAVLEKGKT